MPVVASSVSPYARAARSRTTSMWNSMDSVSGCTSTTATSLPFSSAYSLNAMRRGSFASLNAMRRGSFASMKSESSGTRLFSSSSLPSLSLLVAMKMNGPGISTPCILDRSVSAARLLVLGHKPGDRVDILGRESDLGRGEVLFEVNDARGPRDGKHPRRAVQLPCERDLLHGPSGPGGDRVKHGADAGRVIAAWDGGRVPG